MEQSLDLESSSRDIKGPTEHDTKRQLEPTTPGETPVAAVTEPSQWIVWTHYNGVDMWEPDYYTCLVEARKAYDWHTNLGHRAKLTLLYHAD